MNSSKNGFLSRTNPHGTWIRNVSLYHLLIWGVLWHAKLQETEKKNLSAHAEDGNKLRHDARAKRLGQRREIEINSETMYVGNIKIESDGQTERKTEIERTACTRLVQSQWVKVNRVGGEISSARFSLFFEAKRFRLQPNERDIRERLTRVYRSGRGENFCSFINGLAYCSLRFEKGPASVEQSNIAQPTKNVKTKFIWYPAHLGLKQK